MKSISAPPPPPGLSYVPDCHLRVHEAAGGMFKTSKKTGWK